MKITSIRLPKSQKFPTSRRTIKKMFGDVEVVNAYFGSLFKSFTYDSRCQKRPKVSGPIVASLHITRDGSVFLQFYPVASDDYPEEAVGNFETTILPHWRAWLLEKLSRLETSILGHEELMAEWSDNKHICHKLRYL